MSTLEVDGMSIQEVRVYQMGLGLLDRSDWHDQ